MKWVVCMLARSVPFGVSACRDLLRRSRRPFTAYCGVRAQGDRLSPCQAGPGRKTRPMPSRARPVIGDRRRTLSADLDRQRAHPPPAKAPIPSRRHSAGV